METPETIRISLQQGEWVTSLDFSDAYFHVPIHTRSRKYLRFHFQNQSYQFRALPFGLSTALMEFTGVVKEVKLMAQARGIRIYQYLDDWLIRAPSRESCHQGTQSLLARCQELGWVVNLQKSELEPKQVFEFVGYQYDLSHGLVKPIQNHWESILQKVKSILSNPTCQVRKFMSLIGLLTATEKQVPLGRLHMRPIQWHLKNIGEFPNHWKRRFQLQGPASVARTELINNPSKEPDTLYKQYHTTLSTLIDKHAPIHTKHTKAKYIPGWVNDTVIAAKETKSLFERIWRRNRSTFNRSQYMQKVHQYNRVCMQAKSQFLKEKIQDNHHNPQKLWRVLGDVLHRLPAKILPSINPLQLLADRFVEFFTEKIEKIRSTFSASVNLQHITPDSPPPMFPSFSTVTEEEVTKIITSSPSKSCSLDPWPTFLVLDYLDILISPITSIINASLNQGKCPDFFKQAHVTPLLKKSSLDKEVFKNYRPVSNLNFISKILERVVAVQLQTHLDEAGLLTAFQSSYRNKFYNFTESALLNIHNNILLNMAKGSVTALTLLDLFAAFDTIDHAILLDRLNVYYGISELALGWFRSYLSGRTHSVKIGSTLSHPASLQYGVPQGSVLGPILFSLYTNPISSIIHSHSSIDFITSTPMTPSYTYHFHQQISLYPKTKELPK